MEDCNNSGSGLKPENDPELEAMRAQIASLFPDMAKDLKTMEKSDLE